MSICRIAMLAFIWGDLLRYDGYTESDLRDMIQWCRDMLAEGLTVEPHDKFDLLGFIAWAEGHFEEVSA